MGAGFLVDVELYDGQFLQSEDFYDRRGTISTFRDMKRRTMVKRVAVINIRTGEVVRCQSSYAEASRAA